MFLTIPCVSHDSTFVIDSIRRLSLTIHWRLQGLQWLCFRWWFIDEQWHCVFDNSLRRPWLYFCYWFDASVVNSVMLSIPYVSCHSVFIDDFKVYSDSVFADDLWISRHISLLTIPCVSHESICAIDLMCWLWIYWRSRLHTSVVTYYSLTIIRSTGTLFSLMISSIFVIDFMRW